MRRGVGADGGAGLGGGSGGGEGGGGVGGRGVGSALASVREAAAWLGVGRATVRRLMVRGDLPCVHVGTHVVRIPWAALAAYVSVGGSRRRPGLHPRGVAQRKAEERLVREAAERARVAREVRGEGVEEVDGG